MIRNSEGRSSSIAAIARHAAMSQSALEGHFRAAVGVTSKKLSRLARLQHICRLWNAGKTLTDIAFEAATAINRTWCATSGSSPAHLRRRFFAKLLRKICRFFQVAKPPGSLPSSNETRSSQLSYFHPVQGGDTFSFGQIVCRRFGVFAQFPRLAHLRWQPA